jgi:hypothetical protein
MTGGTLIKVAISTRFLAIYLLLLSKGIKLNGFIYSILEIGPF